MVSKNTKYANVIVTHSTKVPEIAISIASKPKEGSGGTFTHYIKKKYEDPVLGNDLSEEWAVTAILPRRLSARENSAMAQYPGSRYDWQCFVHFVTGSDTPVSLGKQLARGLTKFTRDKELSGMENADVYVFKSAEEHPNSPLSHFLLDEDVVELMKIIHSEEMQLHEVMENDEILEQFFESASKAKEILADMDESDWIDI